MCLFIEKFRDFSARRWFQGMVLNSVGTMLLNCQGTRGQRLAREVLVHVSSVFTSSDISNETSCHRQRLVWKRAKSRVG